MTTRLLAVFLVLLAVTTGKAGSNPLPEKPMQLQLRVGRIFITGNTCTPDRILLRQLRLYPGQVLDPCELTAAERRLARLNLFVGKPTVQVINPGPADEFKDILVKVAEKRNLDSSSFFWLCRIEDLVEGTPLEAPLQAAEEMQETNPCVVLGFLLVHSYVDAFVETAQAVSGAFQ